MLITKFNKRTHILILSSFHPPNTPITKNKGVDCHPLSRNHDRNTSFRLTDNPVLITTSLTGRFSWKSQCDRTGSARRVTPFPPLPGLIPLGRIRSVPWCLGAGRGGRQRGTTTVKQDRASRSGNDGRDENEAERGEGEKIH